MPRLPAEASGGLIPARHLALMTFGSPWVEGEVWCALTAQLDPQDPRPEVAQSLVESARKLITTPILHPKSPCNEKRRVLLDALLPRIHWALAVDPRGLAPTAAWSLLDSALRSKSFSQVYAVLAPYVAPAEQTLDWSLLDRHAGRKTTDVPFWGLAEHPEAWAWALAHTPPEVRGAMAARLLAFNRVPSAIQAVLGAGALDWPWPMAQIYAHATTNPKRLPAQRMLIWESWQNAIQALVMDRVHSPAVRAKFQLECQPIRNVVLTDYYRAQDRLDALASCPAVPGRPRPRS